jgi:hypothetical protein
VHGILDALQRDEVHAVGERPAEIGRDAQREARLADAGRSGQRQQLVPLKPPFDLGELALPADEAGEWAGESDGPGGRGRARRGGVGQAARSSARRGAGRSVSCARGESIPATRSGSSSQAILLPAASRPFPGDTKGATRLTARLYP